MSDSISYNRFLSLLRVPRRPPGLDALGELVEAFQLGVPFENISKLRRVANRPEELTPTLAEYLDEIERRQLGGTCLTNNPFMYGLLSNLGYLVELWSADMGPQDRVHTCLVVSFGDERFLVDVGFSAPFFDPIPLADLPFEIRHGPRVYRLKHWDEPGRYQMSVVEEGNALISYETWPQAVLPTDLENAIDFSFRPGATFMSCLAITKHFSRGLTRTLRDLRLTERTLEGQRVTHFASLAEAEAFVHGPMEMPEAPVRDAARVLSEIWDVHPFPDL